MMPPAAVVVAVCPAVVVAACQAVVTRGDFLVGQVVVADQGAVVDFLVDQGAAAQEVLPAALLNALFPAPSLLGDQRLLRSDI